MKLLVNADDFGRSREINSAVVRAHREGVLTSASLMVAGAAADEAVALARDNPGLAVGLHLVVVDGPAALPVRQIPHLVNPDGQFPNHPVRLGLAYMFDPRARRELAAEVEAQFERFAGYGLRLSHVDGHQHMHMHPAVFDLLVPLAGRYGAGGVRVVRDDFRLAWNFDRSHPVSRAIGQGVFDLLARRCRRRLDKTALGFADRTYGFHRSGRMTEAYVLAVLDAPAGERTEIYFHPTDGPRLDILGPNQDDLRALLSAAVCGRIGARGLHPAGYRDFAGRRPGGSEPARAVDRTVALTAARTVGHTGPPAFAAKASHR